MTVLIRLREMVETDAHAVRLGPWSTGEKLAVALALDRADWLKAMGYTMLEAIERVGPTWVAAARTVQNERA